MSREIKFRLWNNSGNYSKYFFDYENVMECLKQQMYFNADINDKRGWNHEGEGCSFEQYTGLKDKNGEEIYEGDIVEHYDFEDGSLKLRIGWHQGIYNMVAYYGIGDNDYITMEEIEHEHSVIGNIHQNPELL